MCRGPGVRQRLACSGLYNPGVPVSPGERQREAIGSAGGARPVPLNGFGAAKVSSQSLRNDDLEWRGSRVGKIMHGLSWCNRQTMQSTTWEQVQRKVSNPVRITLEKVLVSLNGGVLNRAECRLLAEAEGD